eukprot:gene2541-2580_t
MSRLLDTPRLILASHNKGKLREMRDLMADYGIEIVSAGELGLTEPEETGQTFIENAELKALTAAKAAQIPSFADDSGLCVEALNNEPGIYSARWAGESKDFYAAMAKIEDLLQQAGAHMSSQRRAHFVSALTIAWPDGHVESFEGKIYGEIVWPPRGDAGFGYDPFFLPEGHDRTFGEMTAEEKHGLPKDGGLALSHRARAFQMLAKACLKKPA